MCATIHKESTKGRGSRCHTPLVKICVSGYVIVDYYFGYWLILVYSYYSGLRMSSSRIWTSGSMQSVNTVPGLSKTQWNSRLLSAETRLGLRMTCEFHLNDDCVFRAVSLSVVISNNRQIISWAREVRMSSPYQVSSLFWVRDYVRILLKIFWLPGPVWGGGGRTITRMFTSLRRTPKHWGWSTPFVRDQPKETVVVDTVLTQWRKRI